MDIKSIDKEHVAGTYGRFDLLLTKGSGSVVCNEQGKQYLDFTSGIGVNSLGFCDSDWVNAVSAQAGKLQHTSNLYYTEPGALLARSLCERTGMSRVFFANSGAEANEGAVKLARKYSFLKYGEGRHTVVTLKNSFHGRTMAMLSATGQDSYHEYFMPFPTGFAYVPANDFESFKELVEQDASICAIMLEIVQGEGGVIPLEAEYISKLAAFCAERDILIIDDEVQTGIGRTGRFLACENFDLTPDIVSLAKGLGGGLPIGAILFGDKVKDSFAPGDHGSTFGANPIACAGANVVISKLTDAFLESVRIKGDLLKSELLKLPRVKSVEGMGLMLGITLSGGIDLKEVIERAMEGGLLTLSAKTKLRLLPPLSVSEDEIMQAVGIIKAAMSG